MEVRLSFFLLTGSSGVSSLDHESFDNPMENVSIVIAILRVNAEIFNRFRSLPTKQFQEDIAKGSVNDSIPKYLLDGLMLSDCQDIFLARLFVENIPIDILQIRGKSPGIQIKSLLLVSRAK